MKNAFRFRFETVDVSQKKLIHHWLEEQHIREWLHGQGLQNTLEDLAKSFQGSSLFQHWIAYDNEIPFGYLLTSEEGPHAITLDVFIGDLNYLGKGLAVQMIQEFLISQFPHKKEVWIDPQKTNTRAIHVYEKVGFQITQEFIAKWNPVPHYKMLLTRRDV
jgi:RimJ/RimL family protein N-acetyltransferase